MDVSYNAVLETLGKAASQNVELLKDAEQQLKCWETQPGFFLILLDIAFDQNIDVNRRWLSIICAKNGVETHWEHAAITGEEKCAIRQKLLVCLYEPLNQIALQSAMIISKIAFWDFPEDWKELFPTLLNGMQSMEQIHSSRALLIGHHVMKTLSSNACTKNFEELTTTIFSTISLQWMRYNNLFLEVVQTDVEKSSQFLENAHLNLKILKSLVSHGFSDDPCELADTYHFLSHIFQQIEPLLECRMALLKQEYILKIFEKYIVLLVKVLHKVLKHYPLTFIHFIRPTLDCSVKYCFNTEFKDRVFERLIICFLNLIKKILLTSAYNMPLGYISNFVERNLVEEWHKIKAEFFTRPVINDMCQQLLSRYFILSENDYNNWENDPEDFASEETGDCWKVCLRSCTEDFFSSLVGVEEFRDAVKTFVVETAKVAPINSTADIIGCLRNLQIDSGSVVILEKEAVYKAVGLVANLFDDIDFNKWFTDVLIPELKIKEKGYYIIRRRVIWLIGQFCKIEVSEKPIPLLYDVILESMSNDENLVVRLTAANTLKFAVSDKQFQGQLFLPFLEKSISVLFHLLLEVTDYDLKVSVLHVVSIIIKAMKTHIKPYVNSLIQYLPQLWEICGDHNMLRCAIISCYTQLVESLEIESESIQSSLIPMIALSTDLSQPPHIYLLEDGLDLWWGILKHTNTCSPCILNLAQNILPILELNLAQNISPILVHNNGNLKISLKITEAYIFLSPDVFFKRHGCEIAKIFLSSITDLETKGINRILKVIEKALASFPEDSHVYFKPLIPSVLKLILCSSLKNHLLDQSGKIQFSVLDYKKLSHGFGHRSLKKTQSLYLCLLFRFILHNPAYFVNVLQEEVNQSKENFNILFGKLFDIWFSFMPFLTPDFIRKLMALALARLLTSGSEIVYDRISFILRAVVQVLGSITGSIFDSFITFTPDMYVHENINFSFCSSMHETRRMKARHNDPIFSVVLRNYFCDQMRVLEQSVGCARFQDLMSSVDLETKQKVQFYLQDKQLNPADVTAEDYNTTPPTQHI